MMKRGSGRKDAGRRDVRSDERIDEGAFPRIEFAHDRKPDWPRAIGGQRCELCDGFEIGERAGMSVEPCKDGCPVGGGPRRRDPCTHGGDGALVGPWPQARMKHSRDIVESPGGHQARVRHDWIGIRVDRVERDAKGHGVSVVDRRLEQRARGGSIPGQDRLTQDPGRRFGRTFRPRERRAPPGQSLLPLRVDDRSNTRAQLLVRCEVRQGGRKGFTRARRVEHHRADERSKRLRAAEHGKRPPARQGHPSVGRRSLDGGE